MERVELRHVCHANRISVSAVIQYATSLAQRAREMSMCKSVGLCVVCECVTVCVFVRARVSSHAASFGLSPFFWH